jgi:hypothetical protein
MLAGIAAARHVDIPKPDRLQRGHHARVLAEADPGLNRAVSQAESHRPVVFPDEGRLENNYIARHAPGFLSPADKSLADAIVSPTRGNGFDYDEAIY